MVEALATIADEKAPAGKRVEYASLFGEVKQQKAVHALLETLARTSNDELKSVMLNSLQAYSDANIATFVLAQYGNFNDDVRSVAQSLLVSRKPWATQLVEAVDRGEIAAASLPLDTVRRLTIHKDERLAGMIQAHWSHIEGATTSEMQAMMERYSTVLAGAATLADGTGVRSGRSTNKP